MAAKVNNKVSQIASTVSSSSTSVTAAGRLSATALNASGKYDATGADPNFTTTNLFRNTKDFKDVTRYRLMRGVPDFGSLVQFNPYESGYGAFIICQVPKFMEMLADQKPYYRKLLLNWCHVVEYEFKSFEGLEPMSVETQTLGDDLNNINYISRVNMQSASEFSLTYDEKMGSLMTKFNRAYLSYLKDPRTQVKTYGGLIHQGLMEPGFENECFTFLFINTDNTMRNVEAAYLIVAAQLNAADLDMYNYTKGTIEKKEITVKFNGYPITNAYVDQIAHDMINFLLTKEAGARQILLNSTEFLYTGIDTAAKTLANYGAKETQYPSVAYGKNTVPAYQASNFYQTTNEGYNTNYLSPDKIDS